MKNPVFHNPAFLESGARIFLEMCDHSQGLAFVYAPVYHFLAFEGVAGQSGNAGKLEGCLPLFTLAAAHFGRNQKNAESRAEHVKRALFGYSQLAMGQNFLDI